MNIDVVNLESSNNKNCNPIHYIFQHYTPEMIKYIIDSKNDENCKPIHYIFQHSTPEMIKYIIDNEVYHGSETFDEDDPLDLVHEYPTPERSYIINE